MSKTPGRQAKADPAPGLRLGTDGVTDRWGTTGRAGGGGQDRTVARRQLVQSPEENRTGSVAGEDLRELTLLLRICVE